MFRNKITGLGTPLDSFRETSFHSRAAPPQANEMSTAAVITAVRRLRYAPAKDRNGQTMPGMKTIAEAAGLSRQTVYTISNTGTCTEAQRAALAEAYAAVQNRRFKKRRLEP